MNILYTVNTWTCTIRESGTWRVLCCKSQRAQFRVCHRTVNWCLRCWEASDLNSTFFYHARQYRLTSIVSVVSFMKSLYNHHTTFLHFYIYYVYYGCMDVCSFPVGFFPQWLWFQVLLSMWGHLLCIMSAKPDSRNFDCGKCLDQGCPLIQKKLPDWHLKPSITVVLCVT